MVSAAFAKSERISVWIFSRPGALERVANVYARARVDCSVVTLTSTWILETRECSKGVLFLTGGAASATTRAAAAECCGREFLGVFVQELHAAFMLLMAFGGAFGFFFGDIIQKSLAII